MRYFNEHRRKLIKQNYIRGTKATVSSDTSSVVLDNFFGVIKELKIQGNTEQNQLPSPDNFQEIKNVGNNGLEIKLRGTNLFDESLLLEGIYNYKPNDPRPKEPDVVKTDEGYEVFGNYVTYYGSNNPLLLHLKKIIKPDVEYTLVRNIKTLGPKMAGMISLYISGSPVLSFGNGKSGKQAKTFKFSQEQINNITHFYIYGSWLTDINEGANKTVFEYIQLVEGSYTVDNAPSYEPYIEPTTVSFDITLCGIDDSKDTLVIDFANKKALKKERVLYKRVSDLIEQYGATLDEQGDSWAIYINTIPPKKSVDSVNYYCTHFTSYEKDSNLGIDSPRFEISGDTIWFYYPPSMSVEEFKKWCSDNDVKIAYVLAGEYSKKIEVELPKELPKADTVVLEVSDDNINGLEAVYYSYEKEDSYSLTVHYKDREGNTLLESKTSSVRSGSRYKVIAPEIERYMPVCAEYEGYMNKDTKIVITYSSI